MGVEHLEGRQLLATIVALTEDNGVLRVDSRNPSAILDRRPITGLQGGTGERVEGIDIRPANGQLYAITNEGGIGRLYTIGLATGAATLVGTLAADPGDTTVPYAGLDGTEFGIDFNPVVDRLRVVGVADQNLRINPSPNAMGQVLVITDTPLAYAMGDPNAGVDPSVVEVAYNNNVAGATSTTLLGLEGIDPDLHATKSLPDGSIVPALVLVRQGDPGGAPTSPNSGQLSSLGPFARNGAFDRGFDIAPDGIAYTAVELHFPTETTTALVLINPASGADQALGRIGDSTIRVRDIAVVPSVQFLSGLFATSEDSGTASITVMRTDDGTRPISVEYATAEGTAGAGADYSSVSGRLDFGPGEMTKTIVIPIANDTVREGDESFGVVLRNPSAGTIVGAPGMAQVRINANDRKDRTGPVVTSVLETGPSRGITGFVVHFNEDLEPGRAQKVGNYSLVGIGSGGQRTPIALGSAAYDPARRTVTVTAVQPFMQTQFQQIEFQINGRRNGVTDLAGNRLNRTRRSPGSNAVLRFDIFSGTTVTFVDRDGDEASLSIANGGRLDGIRPSSSPQRGRANKAPRVPATQNTQFWILDPIALRSTLSGTVRPRGDGIVVIAEIIGLDKKEFTPLLSNTSFRVNTLTFSSNATGIG